MIPPSYIFRAGTYAAPLKAMAWNASGWACVEDGLDFCAYGPVSIARSIDLDTAELVGCLDAKLPRPPE